MTNGNSKKKVTSPKKPAAESQPSTISRDKLSKDVISKRLLSKTAPPKMSSKSTKTVKKSDVSFSSSPSIFKRFLMQNFSYQFQLNVASKRMTRKQSENKDDEFEDSTASKKRFVSGRTRSSTNMAIPHYLTMETNRESIRASNL